MKNRAAIWLVFIACLIVVMPAEGMQQGVMQLSEGQVKGQASSLNRVNSSPFIQKDKQNKQNRKASIEQIVGLKNGVPFEPQETESSAQKLTNSQEFFEENKKLKEINQGLITEQDALKKQAEEEQKKLTAKLTLSKKNMLELNEKFQTIKKNYESQIQRLLESEGTLIQMAENSVNLIKETEKRSKAIGEENRLVTEHNQKLIVERNALIEELERQKIVFLCESQKLVKEFDEKMKKKESVGTTNNQQSIVLDKSVVEELKPTVASKKRRVLLVVLFLLGACYAYKSKIMPQFLLNMFKVA